MAPREVVILGSTGSVGTQAIDIVKRNPDKFRVVGLAAGGSDPHAAAQALDLGVDVWRWRRPGRPRTCCWRSTPRHSTGASARGVPGAEGVGRSGRRNGDRHRRVRRGPQRHHGFDWTSADARGARRRAKSSRSPTRSR